MSEHTTDLSRDPVRYFSYLMELSELYKQKRKLKGKLKDLDIRQKLEGIKRTQQKLPSLKKEVQSLIARIEEFEREIPMELNLFRIVKKIRELNQNIKQNRKNRKKRMVDEKTYKRLDVEYRQELEEWNEKLEHLKEFAQAQFHYIKDLILAQEEKEDKLWEKRWTTSSLPRKEYKKQVREIEKKKTPLRNILVFINRSILSDEI